MPPQIEQPDARARDLKIDYVEFVAHDLANAKAFYSATFGWEFTDYGPGYTAFNDGRLSGGFAASDAPPTRGALVILYALDLEATEARITAAGGTITERHEFLGGRRFHFKDTNGVELGVWTDRRADGSRIE
jgi:predicted enzyme related to lactoylglutathione lyase